MDAKNLARLHENLTYWQQQAIQNERDRRGIIKICLAGLPLSAAAFYFKLLYGLAGVALVVTLYLMGMYMTWVRRGEFREAIAEVSEELRTASADAAALPGAAPATVSPMATR